jgi:TPR repeat protein
MRLLSTERSRAGFLLLSLALIGGSGCITASVISQVRSDARQRERERTEQADSQARIAAARAAATDGDPATTVRLAQALIQPVAGVNKYDVEQAVQLLDLAAKQDYAPAQYLLGWIYITGSGDGNAVSRDSRMATPADPARGLALLKQAATRACTYEGRDRYTNNRKLNVAIGIASVYRLGTGVPQDPAQADLWRARAALHCPRSYPAPLRYVIGMPEPLVWARLDPNTEKTRPQIAALLLAMTPEQIAAAEDKERRLRQAVAESERQYPAPPAEK